MAALTLTSVFVAPLYDPSDVLVLGQFAQSESTSYPAQVRRYAGGRDRIVTAPGKTGSHQLSFRYISRADYNTLRDDLTGVAVILRDQRGRVLRGVLSSLEGQEFGPRDLVENASFTLTEISFSEVV